MRQRSDGDEIHARLGNRPHAGQRYATAGLGLCLAFAFLHCQSQLHRIHVIEQHHVRSCGYRLFDLFQRVRFDLYFESRILLSRAPDGCGNGIRRLILKRDQMIVFNEHHIK